MEKKPTPDIREFLTKRDITAGDMKSYYVWQQVIETMQEYADLFHKEKLREELIKFAEWYDGDIIPKELIVEKYLKTKE